MASSVRVLVLDLTSPGLHAVVAEGTKDLEVGLVVCNAALSLMSGFLELELHDVLRSVDLNVRAPLVLAHLFGRRMAERGRGGLVLMSSVAGLIGSPYSATYAGSKAFALAFGDSLWAELEPRGVDLVTCVAGPTETPTYAQVRTSSFPPTMNPDHVVSAALGALGKRPRVVPGLFNRLTTSLVALLPAHDGPADDCRPDEEVCHQATVSLIRAGARRYTVPRVLSSEEPMPEYLFDPDVVHECAMKSLGHAEAANVRGVRRRDGGELSRRARSPPALDLQHRGRRDDPDEALFRVDHEYIMIWGTPIGSEGHSGRHLTGFWDTVIDGEAWYYGEGQFEKSVYKPGDRIYVGPGQARAMNFTERRVGGGVRPRLHSLLDAVRPGGRGSELPRLGDGAQTLSLYTDLCCQSLGQSLGQRFPQPRAAFAGERGGEDADRAVATAA